MREDWKISYKRDLERRPNNNYFFTIDGFNCRISRMPMHHYCGYIQIPRDNGYHDEPNIKVHGGITFMGCDGWVGFDCAHYDDITPKVEMYMETIVTSKIDSQHKTYKTFEFVFDNLKSMAEQLKTK